MTANYEVQFTGEIYGVHTTIPNGHLIRAYRVGPSPWTVFARPRDPPAYTMYVEHDVSCCNAVTVATNAIC